MIIFISLIVSYLIGSIPTGYLIGKKFMGIDIRKEGSGNIGSTNVRRILGKKYSIITQVVDVLKGLIPVLTGYILFNNNMFLSNTTVSLDVYLSMIALAAVIGHNYTTFLKFKGGKGVNTTLGAFFILSPLSVIFGVFTYFFLSAFTRIVSLRSMSLGFVMFLTAFILNKSSVIICSLFFAFILMVWRHRSNIERILKGEEL